MSPSLSLGIRRLGNSSFDRGVQRRSAEVQLDHLMAWLDFSAQGRYREGQVGLWYARVTNAGRRLLLAFPAVNRTMIPPRHALGNQQVLNRHSVPAHSGTVSLLAAAETEAALRVGQTGRARPRGRLTGFGKERHQTIVQRPAAEPQDSFHRGGRGLRTASQARDQGQREPADADPGACQRREPSEDCLAIHPISWALASRGCVHGAPSASSPCRVLRARKVIRGIASEKKRTEPSHSARLAPPGWLLP